MNYHEEEVSINQLYLKPSHCCWWFPLKLFLFISNTCFLFICHLLSFTVQISTVYFELYFYYFTSVIEFYFTVLFNCFEDFLSIDEPPLLTTYPKNNCWNPSLQISALLRPNSTGVLRIHKMILQHVNFLNQC